jgi:hypothetical protein
MNPAFTDKRPELLLIIANLGGGLVAIAAFNLLTVVTGALFCRITYLFFGLIFGETFRNRSLSTLLNGIFHFSAHSG